MAQPLNKTLATFFFRQYPNWVPSGELERMTFKNQNGKVAKPSSVSRALRSLEEKRKIAVKYDGSAQSATYKYLPKSLRHNYIPASQRPAHKRNVMWKVSLEEFRNRQLPTDPKVDEAYNAL